ncbi:toll/interleukin-1 receptor domain-containing protein [Sphingomonas soli]|uniref:toll/interleukin-1 receptor domain-containing protein n=1 Tax=Sphingomonas soli TaxID=266127 RepID=UPI00083476C7|nr:toll/interleukin-1 receptor domain-containing protein [Sphingomonas soli]
MRTDAAGILGELGVDFKRAVQFLKVDCRLPQGFESQTVGLGVRSATTSGIVSYVLASLGVLSESEKAQLIDELLAFRIEDGRPHSYGHLRPNSWATWQLVAGLLALGADIRSVTPIVDAAIERYQTGVGGWCFSSSLDERLPYAIYPVVCMSRLIRMGRVEYVAPLELTASYLRNYVSPTATERLICAGLLGLASEAPGGRYAADLGEIDLSRIISSEFGHYGTIEFTTAPFSMRVYTPALYLITRRLLGVEHPLSRYFLAYLSRSVLDGRAWTHVVTGSPTEPSSFCSALALLSICRGASDLAARGRSADFVNPPLEDLRMMVANASPPAKIFVSYSSRDEATASRIVERLKALGFAVIYAETDLLVGDSIPGYINDALTNMDYLVLLMSPASVASVFVRDEFEGAKSLEWARRRVTILPALIEECQIPAILAPKKYADFRGSFDLGMQQLLKSLGARHDQRRRDP